MLTQDQKELLAQANELSSQMTLGEALRHFSSTQLLDDLTERLKPSGLGQQVTSCEALRFLAGNEKPTHSDMRRILTLAKAIIRAQKTHEKLKRENKIKALS